MSCAATVLLCAVAAEAQPVPRVVPGFGVDTTAAAWTDVSWHSAVPEVYRAWRDYLLSDPHLQQPTPFWSAREQADWPAYDLTAGIAYKGFAATVLDISPARPGVTDELVVRTLFASVSGVDRDVRPVALTRVYAVREERNWVFANALPRVTRDWERITIGPITYVLEPGLELDRARAEGAAAFVDSLANAFGVPRLTGVTHYSARTPEALHRMMGIDWTVGGLGHGYSVPWNGLILSGDAAFADGNRHELAHYVLAPILEERRTHGIINEGIATWLGGSVGRSFDEITREYAAYLRANPDITLDLILEGDGPDRGWAPAGAVLVAWTHERGGTAAVRDLLTSGRTNEELRAALVRLLGVPWPEIQRMWSERATAALRPPS